MHIKRNGNKNFENSCELINTKDSTKILAAPFFCPEDFLGFWTYFHS